ncbi:GON-4-like protein isoform X2 [Entelurus aequoreus]|uniref:GON-4-like protein isoform X2 n=1 Tax=Entelurus aequoreus TaxID=161455 RepID=UPI002B1E127F|nr:GON-4-like protein isoform X2 [Entelurus aequoreus]
MTTGAAKRLKVGTSCQRRLGGDECSLDEDDAPESNLVITTDEQHAQGVRRRAARRRRKTQMGQGDENKEEAGGQMIDSQLDQSLESTSKQHNLTSVNVRNIIHEVITNEHVVAMMKAAINETEAVPPFEPTMTRSKLKEVVEKGVVIPTWNMSPIKKSSDVYKVHQFADIPLAEEDSSDEEYRPDEEEEDETAEDTLQESDLENAASPPTGRAVQRPRAPRKASCTPCSHSTAMAPPRLPKAPPPKVVTDTTFLEKLHAVEEELAVCMEPYQCQPLSQSEEEVGLMAYRTRSKRPLRDVPLGQLEAELRAPDITPDMYDCGSAPEDREWTVWLRSLMSSDFNNIDEECDDEDDPEYNFLADVDEPDQEDYRDDKAVRITKKEVNELMEELFDTLKEDMRGQEVEEDAHEEEEEQQEDTHLCHVSTEEAHVTQDGPIREQRTVKQQLAFIRSTQHTLTLDTQHTHCAHTLTLDTQHRSRLKQQLQQHVQLLTQIHLLTSPVDQLQSEAETTRHYLFELEMLAQRGEMMTSSLGPAPSSAFRASNLQGALVLLDELRPLPVTCPARPHTPDARGQVRSFPVMPAHLAWIFATRPVFLYPQLLPGVSLDPALYCPRRTAAFTAAEDCLLVLGLRNMEGSCDPTRLVSDHLLGKGVAQVRRRILQCCRPGTPNNMVKAFRYQRVLRVMPPTCRHGDTSEQRPPVERDLNIMPLWLQRSLPVVTATAQQNGYPPRCPPNLEFRRVGFVRRVSTNQKGPVGGSETPPPPKCPAHTDKPTSDQAELVSSGPPESSASRCLKELWASSPMAVSAKNVCTGANGERLVTWTRQADRAILTACQRQGASPGTFRQVSAQLGNKSAQQVRLRFHQLVNLFHSATCQEPEPEPC